MVFRGLDGMPLLGRELFARDFALTPGGGALITAAHLAAHGRPSALLARFGTDALSVALSEQIETLGLDLQFLAGAGDAFNAGFIHAWLEGADGSTALAAAIDSGTRSVQASGGTGSIRSAS